MAFRGIERLLEDIRNPEASKERRKAKIDTVPELPRFKGFRVPFIVKAAKEVAKVIVDLGPEGSETSGSNGFIPFFDKTVPQGPVLPGGTFRSPPKIEERITMPGTGDKMLDELVAAGISEMEILQIANGIERQVAAMSPAERRFKHKALASNFHNLTWCQSKRRSERYPNIRKDLESNSRNSRNYIRAPRFRT